MSRQRDGIFSGLPSTFWILWLATLIDNLGTLAAPFLVLYLSTKRGLGIDTAAAIVSLGALGSIAGAFAGGILADRLGRKPTLLIGTCASGVAILALALARDQLAIAVLWLASGFGTGLAGPATSALIADVVPAADRMRAYGLRHWALNIGFSVAPILGGLLARASYAGLFLVDGATTLLTAVLVAVRLPRAGAPHEGQPPTRATGALRDRRLLAFLACGLLVACVGTQADSTLPADMASKGISAQSFGLVLALNGVLVMLVSPVATRLLRDADPVRVVAAASVVTAVGFGLHAVVTTTGGYAVAVAIWTAGEIATIPATAAVLIGLAPSDQRGRYSAASAMTWGVARFIGPVGGGLVLARAGAGALWIACAVLATTAALGQLSLARVQKLSTALGKP